MQLDLKPGLVLNETYRLLEIIGRGGMGEVWKAQHERLPKLVAVKVLLDASLAHETSLARFRREAEIATRLGHPNIVEVLDFNTLPGGIPYMVLELLEGQSLRQRLRDRGSLPLPEAVQILRQVSSALSVAHEQGVVHRDLKPENIFLVSEPGEDGPTERAKVLDFGISKIQGSETALTRDCDVLGTPVYMAPEQTAGHLVPIDGRTDQFALAAISYEIIGGRIAFEGHSVIEVLGKVLEGQPVPLAELVPSIPDHVTRALERALSKKPHLRFETVTEFVDALAGGATPRPHTTQTGPVPRMRPSVTAEMATGPTQVLDSEQLSDAQVRVGPGSRAPSSVSTLPLGETQLSESGDAPAQAVQEAPPAPAVVASAPEVEPPDIEPPDAEPPDAGPGAQASEETVTVPTDTARKRPVLLIVLLVVSLVTAVVLAFLLLRGGKPGDPKPAAAGTDDSMKVARAPQGAVDAGGAARTPPRRTATPDGGAPVMRPTVEPPPMTGPAMVPAMRRPPTRPTGMRRPGMRRPPAMRPRDMATMPEQARAHLKRARAALARRSYGEALNSARKSMYVKRTQAALSIMARAYCGRRDLRRAQMALRQLSRGNRRRATAWCKRIGFDPKGN